MGCHIHDCAAHNGGGVYAGEDAATLVWDCVIEDCDATSSGGGIYSSSESLKLESTTICGNTPNQIEGVWNDDGDNFIADSCTPICPDIDQDGQVGANEILLVISYWGSSDNDVDVTGNGIVDAEDLLLIIASWGPCGF